MDELKQELIEFLDYFFQCRKHRLNYTEEIKFEKFINELKDQIKK